MAIVKNVQLFWVKLNPSQPSRYQNKDTAPATWSLQFRVKDKKEAESLAKEFGFKFAPVEDNGAIVYKTSISKYAFASGTNGKEDPTKPNTPVVVIDAGGSPIDPDTVGNGSVGNISFFAKDDKSGRTLRAVQVTTWKVFEPRSATSEFDLSGETEVIKPDSDKAEDSLDSLY